MKNRKYKVMNKKERQDHIKEFKENLEIPCKLSREIILNSIKIKPVYTKFMIKITDMLEFLINYSEGSLLEDEDQIDYKAEFYDLLSEIKLMQTLEFKSYEKLDGIYKQKNKTKK